MPKAPGNRASNESLGFRGEACGRGWPVGEGIAVEYKEDHMGGIKCTTNRYGACKIGSNGMEQDQTSLKKLIFFIL